MTWCSGIFIIPADAYRGIIPQLVLTWLQIAFWRGGRGAIDAVFAGGQHAGGHSSLPGGNLTRFVYPFNGSMLHQSAVVEGIGVVVSLIVPYLGTFD